MRALFLFLLLTALCIGCSTPSTDSQSSADTTAIDTPPQPDLATVCLWKEVGVRETPAEKGKYLTTIYFGEKVTRTGDSAVETIADKRNLYHKIRLSDGKEGWVRDDFIAIEVIPAAIISDAAVHKRPDATTITSEVLKIFEFVAARPTQDGWTEVRAKRSSDKWFITGYVKSSALAFTPIDAEFAVLWRRMNEEQDASKRNVLYETLFDQSAYGGSSLYEHAFGSVEEIVEDGQGAETWVVHEYNTSPYAVYPCNGDASDLYGVRNGVFQGTFLSTESELNSGQAIMFDGESWISIPRPDYESFHGSFSVVVWFRGGTSSQPLQTLVSMGRSADGSAFNVGYNFADRPGSVYFCLQGESPQCIIGSVPEGTHPRWHLLIATYDANSRVMALYQNGKEINRQQLPDSDAARLGQHMSNSSQPIEIGRELATLDRYFTGAIDEVRLYEYALSKEEVEVLARNLEEGMIPLIE